MNAPDPEGHPSGEHYHSGNGESDGGLGSSSSGNVDGGDDSKEGTVLALESVVSRKSAAMSLACSMESGGEKASNMVGAKVSVKGGTAVVDGNTDDWESFIDEESGDSYFVHRRSGKSVWERPGAEKG